jgi:glycerate kinase
MKALVCPDTLKGSLAAGPAARALAAGLAESGVEAIECPLADGGEGTLDALAPTLGGSFVETMVADPLLRPVSARFLLAPDGTAVVEAAEAIGLARLDPDELDPLRASSRGLGELILAAAEAGASSVFVGLGGTATVDGGAGLVEVVDRLPLPTTLLLDVRNPLLGERGAARVFGPQKGASPEQVEELERRLAGLERLAPFAEQPGAGAAGGLGAALMALGATPASGIEQVLELVGFEQLAGRADLAITGEGAVDASSLEGKAVSGVLESCRRTGLPCIVFGGRVDSELWPALRAAGATAVFRLRGDSARAAEDLRDLGRRVDRLVQEARLAQEGAGGVLDLDV